MISTTQLSHPGSSQLLHGALADAPPLDIPSPARDELWLVVAAAVCTRHTTEVTPLGSCARVIVTSDHASDELIAAMTWLKAHEEQARALSPVQLFVTLRGVATRGGNGSGRAAQADALHGLTGVPAGFGIRWCDLGG